MSQHVSPGTIKAGSRHYSIGSMAYRGGSTALVLPNDGRHQRELMINILTGISQAFGAVRTPTTFIGRMVQDGLVLRAQHPGSGL